MFGIERRSSHDLDSLPPLAPMRLYTGTSIDFIYHN
jgi:hypothetical protein